MYIYIIEIACNLNSRNRVKNTILVRVVGRGTLNINA